MIKYCNTPIYLGYIMTVFILAFTITFFRINLLEKFSNYTDKELEIIHKNRIKNLKIFFTSLSISTSLIFYIKPYEKCMI